MDARIWIAGGLLLMNLLGYVLAAADKRKALRKQWRIPERRLMLVAVLGGSVGLYLGFRMFRHKINHPKFMVGVPMILLGQVALAVAIHLFGRSCLLALQRVFG